MSHSPHTSRSHVRTVGITIQETLVVGGGTSVYFVVTMSPLFQEAQEGEGDEPGDESRTAEICLR